MSGQYPPLTPVEVEAILKRAGFSFDRSSGSHHQWKGFIKGRWRLVTVDQLSRRSETYGPKLLREMIRQSGMTRKEFYSYL